MTPRHHLLACGMLALLMHAGQLQAQSPELDALQLADQLPDQVESAREWRRFVEIALGTHHQRDGQDSDSQRLSLDLRYEHPFAPGWQLRFADRIDMSWPAQSGDERAINTLKEAYVSWQPDTDTLLDLGRINVRNGVATGYNPTDYFRRQAVRSWFSIEPASLKENRQGSLMLRGQQLWNGGAFTALYAPALAQDANPEGFNPDFGATNAHDRALLTLSQRIDNTTPQFLLYQEAGQASRVGLNLTGLVDDATIAQFEWSGGRSPRQQALAVPGWPSDPHHWHNQFAGGLTHTTPDKLTLTAEYHYNGLAPDHDDWQALQQGPLPAYAQYRSWSQQAQEPPTRRALFFHALWQDALIPRLDLSLMYQHDLIDASHQHWLELRYPVDALEFALQWQHNSGSLLSHHGAQTDRDSVQGVVRWYF